MKRTKLGHFEIVSQIGAGGMGEVWRAHDPKTGRDVALKLLPANLADDPERLARFQREARTLASLNHPNIAGLFGVEEEDGQPFLIMELVEGEELGELVARSNLSVEEILNLARQLAEGLEEAHEKGIVHRDLKPANIMVTPDGKLKILDFGLARALSGDEVGEGDVNLSPTITSSMTQAGTLLGTAAYMSPEQARGKPVDRRADNWSFGVVLYEMLSGTRLFAGETIGDTLANVLKGEIPIDQLDARVPFAVRQLLERCLERDPRKRLRDIGEARVRLERWRDDPSSLDASFGKVDVELPSAGPRRLIPWAVALLAVAAAAFAWLQPSPEVAPTQTFKVGIHPDQYESAIFRNSKLEISPNGELFAYMTAAGIRILRLAEGTEYVIAGTDGADLMTFSPNGDWIAFTRQGILYRTRIAGGSPIEVSSAPDSRGICWVNDETMVLTPRFNSGLLTVSLADGSTTPLTKLNTEAGERSHRWPTRTPDGKGVVFGCQFLGKDYDQGELRYLPLDGGESQTIFYGGSCPRFGPEGKLFFARAQSIYAIEWKPGDQEFLGLAEPVLYEVSTSVGNQETDDGYAHYAFSKTGVLIYLTGGARETQETLFLVDLESQAERILGVEDGFGLPEFSPSGKQLAVMTLNSSRGSTIQVYDTETGIRTQFSDEYRQVWPGCWSIDGSYLYWTEADDAGRWHIYRREASGRTPPEKLGGRPDGFGTLYLDSVTTDQRWAYASIWAGADVWDVVRIDLENLAKDPELHLGGPDMQYLARISPDQKWLIVSVAPRAGVEDVMIRTIPDNGASWRLMEGDESSTSYTWASDLSAIYFQNVHGFQRVEFIVEDGRPRTGRTTVLSTAPTSPNLNYPAGHISRDGRLGAGIRDTSGQGASNSPRLMLVSDFGAELRKKQK